MTDLLDAAKHVITVFDEQTGRQVEADAWDVARDYIKVREQLEERDRVIAELAKQKQNAIESHHAQEYRIRQLVDALNAANNNFEHWTWIPGEENHLETLSCPVKIPAEWLRNLIDEPKQQNTILREALKFYADNSNYERLTDYYSGEDLEITNVLLDGGDTASKAIAKIGGTQDG